MSKFTVAATAALWTALIAAPGLSQSCTVIPMSPDTGSGAVSGFVLDAQPLCYFLDWTNVRGEARLVTDNACFTPEGLADCTRAYSFSVGDNGFRFFVAQDRLQAKHAYFTLQVTVY